MKGISSIKEDKLEHKLTEWYGQDIKKGRY